MSHAPVDTRNASLFFYHVEQRALLKTGGAASSPKLRYFPRHRQSVEAREEASSHAAPAAQKPWQRSSVFVPAPLTLSELQLDLNLQWRLEYRDGA
jgi:hypothetical protein